jgi:hypothetical protein
MRKLLGFMHAIGKKIIPFGIIIISSLNFLLTTITDASVLTLGALFFIDTLDSLNFIFFSVVIGCIQYSICMYQQICFFDFTRE